MPACPKCGALIVWMGTSGGKRMPIDAVLKDLLEPGRVWVQEDGAHTDVTRKVKGYTSHLSTCPHRDSAAPQQPQEKKP